MQALRSGVGGYFRRRLYWDSKKVLLVERMNFGWMDTKNNRRITNLSRLPVCERNYMILAGLHLSA